MQEVWKISTTIGAGRVKKRLSSQEAPPSCSHTTKEAESHSKQVGSSGSQLRRTSSFDRTWEENVAESIAAELVLNAHSSSVSSSKSDPFSSMEQPDESSKIKSKESKSVKSGRSSHEEKKVGKSLDEKRSRPRKVMEFQNIKISQVGHFFVKDRTLSSVAVICVVKCFELFWCRSSCSLLMKAQDLTCMSLSC